MKALQKHIEQKNNENQIKPKQNIHKKQKIKNGEICKEKK